MQYLYFAEAVVETGDDGASEALMVPAASFVGADPVGTTSTAFYFKNAMGNKDSTHKVVLTVVLMISPTLVLVYCGAPSVPTAPVP